MTNDGVSTIAQLLFPSENSIDFARIVAELELVLTRLNGVTTDIAWDCEDFVCFQIPGRRFVLAWSEVARRGFGGCLSVAVGPGRTGDGGDPADLCSRLVDRIQSRFDPLAVLWCQAEGVTDAEVIDTLVDQLPHLIPMLPAALPPVDSLLDGLVRAEDRLILGIAANDQPALPRERSVELANVRAALYPEHEPQMVYSTQLRLAAHCLNATLILVYAPLGAAVMTYSLLRGEDMRLSSRMMAVAGTLFALSHSPVGQTVAAMAGGLG
jgi:hypothetical protein